MRRYTCNESGWMSQETWRYRFQPLQQQRTRLVDHHLCPFASMILFPAQCKDRMWPQLSGKTTPQQLVRDFLQSQEKPPTKEALAFCIYRGAYKNTCVLSYIIHRKVLNLHIKKYCNCDCVPTCKEAKNKKRESMMSRAKCIGGKLMMIFQIGSSCFAYFFVWV